MTLTNGEMATLPCSPSQFRSLSDEDLMAALCAGYGDALAVLFERHSAQVFRVARAILKDDGEAEETVQRVFLDIYQAASQFDRDRGTFTTWLLQYAYHRSLNRRSHLRANHFYTRHELNDFLTDELPPGRGQLVCLPPQELACLIEQVLATLHRRQRKIIELTYFDGLTAEEIAKKTGDSVSSVRHNLYRGLAKLRNVLLESRKAESVERTARVKGMLVEQPRTL
jgi:RNA polymerase sigma-70 factor, ECF subfamily